MATTPRSVTQSPTRQPPVLTLIGASRTLAGDVTPDTGAPVRWEGGGVEFEPLPCNVEFAPFQPGCGQMALTDRARPDPLAFDTINLWTGVRCSSRPGELEAGQARARQLLLIDQHRQLEHEFWTGDLHQSADPDMEGRWLAQDGVVTELSGAGQSSPLVYALAALQEALGSGSGAGVGCGRGMIHATVQTVSLWFSSQALRREGGLLLDVFDNIIVPGVGYDGSAPDGTVDGTGETAWAYATGIVDTRLAEIVTMAAHDPADNDVDAIAAREAIAYWDGCCHYGINVNLCDTACGG